MTKDPSRLHEAADLPNVARKLLHHGQRHPAVTYDVNAGATRFAAALKAPPGAGAAGQAAGHGGGGAPLAGSGAATTGAGGALSGGAAASVGLSKAMVVLWMVVGAGLVTGSTLWLLPTLVSPLARPVSERTAPASAAPGAHPGADRLPPAEGAALAPGPEPVDGPQDASRSAYSEHSDDTDSRGHAVEAAAPAPPATDPSSGRQRDGSTGSELAPATAARGDRHAMDEHVGAPRPVQRHPIAVRSGSRSGRRAVGRSGATRPRAAEGRASRAMTPTRAQPTEPTAESGAIAAQKAQVMAAPAEERAHGTARAAPAPQPVAAADERMPAPEANAPSLQSQIMAELRAVTAARAAVAHSPARALSILKAIDAVQPRGQLMEERAALRVVALDNIGRHGQAAKEGTRFLQSYPKSPFAAHVRAILAGEN